MNQPYGPTHIAMTEQWIVVASEACWTLWTSPKYCLSSEEAIKLLSLRGVALPSLQADDDSDFERFLDDFRAEFLDSNCKPRALRLDEMSGTIE